MWCYYIINNYLIAILETFIYNFIMFWSKKRIIIGLTTFNSEFLNLSVPAVGRFSRRCILVVHNDNPDVRIKKRQIRKMGFYGCVYVINSKQNIGLLRSRIAIVDFVRVKKIRSDWIMFVDDDDIVTDISIPRVGKNNFAVIQNMVVLRSRLIDVLRVAKNPKSWVVDNENVYMVRPHVGLAGTMIRLSVMFCVSDVLCRVQERVAGVDSGLSFRPPTDMMMWSAVNIIARHYNSFATPIYMDTVNYVATDIDTATHKYGMAVAPAKNTAQQIGRVIAKYDAIIRAELSAGEKLKCV